MKIDKLFPKEEYPLSAHTSYVMPGSKNTVVITAQYSEPTTPDQNIGFLIMVRNEREDVLLDAVLFLEYDNSETYFFNERGDFLPIEEDAMISRVAACLALSSEPPREPYTLWSFLDRNWAKFFWQQ